MIRQVTLLEKFVNQLRDGEIVPVRDNARSGAKIEMTETTTPEVNVAELMERVRAKADQIRRAYARSRLPAIHEVAPLAQAIVPKPVAARTDKIMQARDAARRAITVPRWIPRPIRRLFRRQAAFDYEVLRAIESIAQTNAQLVERLRHLAACVEVQDQGIQHLAALRRTDAQWMHAVAQVVRLRDEEIAWMHTAGRLISSVAERRDNFDALIDTIRSEIASLQKRGDATDERHTAVLQRIDALAETGRQQDEEVKGIAAQAAREHDDLESLRQRLGTLAQYLNTVARHGEQSATQIGNLHAEQTALQTSLGAVADDLNAFRAAVGAVGSPGGGLHIAKELGAEADEHAALRSELQSLEQRQTTDSAFIKAELSRLSLALQKSIEQLAAPSPSRRKQAAGAALADATAHQLDAFYFSFENRFRGPRAEIKKRVRYYLPFVMKSGAGSAKAPVLDIGSGRGEWLELLREKNLVASGVEVNGSMIEQCRERGLNVAEGDALEFLSALNDDSQGAVTGFHIIEHLTLETVIRLLRETYRVLRPGGIAIFETPNCKNLVVGACNFYIDPTHRNPIFPETAQFMLESVGFERITLEYLSPVAPSDRPEANGESPHLRELLYGPRDFGVIGHKPGAG